MKKEIKKIGLKLDKHVNQILLWVFSIIFLIFGLVFIFSSPITGIFFTLAGLLIFIPFTKFIKKKYKFELSEGLTICLMVIFLIVAFSTISVTWKDEVDKLPKVNEINQENLGQSIIPEDTKEISDILKKQVYWELVELQDKIPFNDISYDEKIDETEKTIKDKYNLTDEEFKQIKYQGSVELWPIPEYEEPSE